MKAKPKGRRCSYHLCGHLWRFHSKANEHGQRSCSQCFMRHDKGPSFLKKGTRFPASYSHDLRKRHPKCNCRMTERKVCSAVLYHGPGHQSHTHCQIKGRHKTHEVRGFGWADQNASWRGKLKVFTGFFDEAPTVD